MRFSTRLFLLVILVSSALAGMAQSQSGGSIQEATNLGKNVTIFPNPAIEFVNIRIESISAQNVRLTLHNIIGNEMPTETEIVSPHELRIRVKDLASGYYLLAIRDTESKFRGTYKILKK